MGRETALDRSLVRAEPGPCAELRAAPAQSPARGSVITFDDVYREHAAFVFRLLRGMGVADSLADDALQDVFLVVHRQLDKFDGRARVSTWLFAITYRVACSYRRKSRRASRQGPLSDELASPLRSPQQQAENSQLMQRLARALDALDDEKRMVVLLADLEGLSVPQISELTGVPLNTVYTRLRRARAAVAAELRSKEAP